jgi:hypothetical protein
VKFLWHTESAKRRRPPVPNIRITEADFLVGKKNGNPAFESTSFPKYWDAGDTGGDGEVVGHGRRRRNGHG